MVRLPEAARHQIIASAFRQESESLLRWLTGRLGNPHDAQDVLQSAYLKVIAFSNENEIVNIRALISRTAATIAIDELRARSRYTSRHIAHDPSDEFDAASRLESMGPSGEQALQVREDVAAAISVLDALPAKVRASFLLSRLDDLTYSEIAAKLGVSVSSVEKYIARAAAALHAHARLNGEEKSGPAEPSLCAAP